MNKKSASAGRPPRGPMPTICWASAHPAPKSAQWVKARSRERGVWEGGRGGWGVEMDRRLRATGDGGEGMRGGVPCGKVKAENCQRKSPGQEEEVDGKR